jgi:predicted dehydrogenase
MGEKGSVTGMERHDDRPLRGAFIGFGNAAARAHLPAWEGNDDFRIVAVAEPDPERARLAAQLLPHADLYRETGPLFCRNDIDFVDICAPSGFHEELVKTACRAGLHVLCEKPLVTSPGGLAMIDEANALGSVVFTVNNWKHAPLWVKTFQLLSEGRIGIVRHVSLAVLRPPNSGGGLTDWRRRREIAGGGILLDHGWHHLYVIRSLMNEAPETISAGMSYAGGVEETVTLTMTFRAAQANVFLTWQGASRRNHGTIRGEKGEILIEDDHLILLTDSPAVRHDFPEALSRTSHHPEWMEEVIKGFRREIIDEEARGENLAEARWCSRVTHLAYQSSREGSRPVRSDGLEEGFRESNAGSRTRFR